MILLIDNFDSFTYNIYQSFAEEGIEVKVIRSNQITIQKVTDLQPEAIIISPGSGLPDQSSICTAIVQHFYKYIPILGICFGQHIIATAFGAKLTKAKMVKHGKTSLIIHNGLDLFSYLSQPLEVMLYHSHVIDPETLPEQIETIASSLETNEIMAIKHRRFPLYGLQFHPESIGTKTGRKMLQNFLKEIRRVSTHEEIS